MSKEGCEPGLKRVVNFCNPYENPTKISSTKFCTGCKTESSQPNFSSILRLKEGELLLVWSKWDCIWLEALSIHFESLVFI